MLIEDVFNDKELRMKEKTIHPADALLADEITIERIIEYSKTAIDTIKATCMGAFEIATKSKPEMSTLELLEFAQRNLLAKAPRLKWESAKVIGNIAHLYPDRLEISVKDLLTFTLLEGTVVRWSAAYALSKIVSLPKYSETKLVEQLKKISLAEEKISIKFFFEKSLKKMEL